MLGTNHRAAHEPERDATLSLILSEARSAIGTQAVRDYLVERDHRLDLDYDLAWANQFLLSHLVELFPDAKFVGLVRDPSSWLQSIVGRILVRDVPQDVKDPGCDAQDSSEARQPEATEHEPRWGQDVIRRAKERYGRRPRR